MNNIVKTLITLIIIATTTTIALSHPPKTLTIRYSNETQMLYIKIDHKVKDVEKHYINSIEIEVNGEVVKSITPENQLNLDFENYQIIMKDLKDGDKITVSANCNMFGKDSESMTIKKE